MEETLTLVFIIFIVDLMQSFLCYVLGHAEDIKLFSSISSQNDVRDLQNNINILLDWSKLYNLCLNIEKCNCALQYCV